MKRRLHTMSGFRYPLTGPRIAFATGLLIVVLTIAIGVGHFRKHRSDPVRMYRPLARAISPPPVPLPKVEPFVVVDLAPGAARALNASIPFAPSSRAARPFVFRGSALDAERARTCLASAVWYEAGDDRAGEKAVAQVILNRVRHPAFPKSICGVIFQGAERATGCQFTFACDGSLRRTPPPDAWTRARAVADRAMSGFVLRNVGTATHYHADWVVPYWSASLDKMAKVHSHLFFRWRGWWGQPAAFVSRYRGPEAIDPRIVRLAGIDAQPAMEQPDATQLATGGSTTLENPPRSVLGRNVVRLIDSAKIQYVLELDARADPGSYATTALGICKGKTTCSVIGWLKPDRLPRTLPVTPPMMRSASFLYRRQAALGRNQIYWNCQQLSRKDQSQCLPGTGPAPIGAISSSPDR